MELSLKFDKLDNKRPKNKMPDLNLGDIGSKLQDAYKNRLVKRALSGAKEAEIPEDPSLPDGLVVAKLCQNCQKSCKVSILPHATLSCPDVDFKPLKLK